MPRLSLAVIVIVLSLADASAMAGPASTVVYQAEFATIGSGVKETTNAGFTGPSYVNYDAVAGSFVEWTVNVPTAVNATLGWRYANAPSADRPMEIRVNGVVVAAALSFPTTGAWTTWLTRTLVAALVAGDNVIRATATGVLGGPNVDSLSIDSGIVDWSAALVDSTMARFPSAASLGAWDYTRTFYFDSQYQVWRRTGNMTYINRLRSWVDAHVNASGVIDVALNTLDSMQGMNVLIDLYNETGQAKYKTAATSIRTRLNSYPRTTQDGNPGALIHQTPLTGQLWADGGFMLNPGLSRYGHTFNDAAYTDTEVTRQMLIYANRLRSSVAAGLFLHAYDETGASSWANPTTHQSPEIWCRAVGWYGLAMINLLETIDPANPDRPALLTNLQNLVAGLATYQDLASGRWFQVVDKASTSGNFTETSCSAMHTFVISRAVERGYVSPSFSAQASAGYQGTLGRISLDGSGMTNLTNIVVATGPGNLAFYLARPQATNDFHGLGAFLVMQEQLAKPAPGVVYRWIEAESGTRTAPLVAGSDPAASGGSFIQVTAGNNSTGSVPTNGHATYNVNVAQNGAYRVWGRVMAPTINDDSFWLRVDSSSTWVQWNDVTDNTAAWRWVIVHDTANGETNQLWPLTIGNHVVEIAYREDGIKLDKLLVTNDLSFVPTGTGN
ncbi:MAG TPA: glycoside hydrolase family 88 protein [Polyangia bacterium]|nr:glycoside hydrolase family 88 protein [Polyangia bacterium]